MLIYFEKRIQKPLTWSREAKKGVGKKILVSYIFNFPWKRYLLPQAEGFLFCHSKFTGRWMKKNGYIYIKHVYIQKYRYKLRLVIMNKNEVLVL
jgi:hypothetical protein